MRSVKRSGQYGGSVFVRESPLAVYERRLKIVVGIAALVARRAVADLQVDDILRRFVDQVMGVARAGEV